jgi:hypothetical protein
MCLEMNLFQTYENEQKAKRIEATDKRDNKLAATKEDKNWCETT